MSEPVPVQQHLLQDFMRGGGKDLDVVRYFHLLRRNLWLILLVVGSALVGTFVWLSRQPKEYGSRMVIQVEQEEQQILSKDGEIQPHNLNADDYLNTIVQSLTNQTLMLRVAKGMGLDRDPKL